MDGRRFISHAVGSTNPTSEADLAVESHWSGARWPTHLAIGARNVCSYLSRRCALVLLPLLHGNRLRPCLQPSRRRQFGIRPKAKSHRARHGCSLMPLPDCAAPPTRSLLVMYHYRKHPCPSTARRWGSVVTRDGHRPGAQENDFTRGKRSRLCSKTPRQARQAEQEHGGKHAQTGTGTGKHRPVLFRPPFIAYSPVYLGLLCPCAHHVLYCYIPSSSSMNVRGTQKDNKVTLGLANHAKVLCQPAIFVVQAQIRCFHLVDSTFCHSPKLAIRTAAKCSSASRSPHASRKTTAHKSSARMGCNPSPSKLHSTSVLVKGKALQGRTRVADTPSRLRASLKLLQDAPASLRLAKGLWLLKRTSPQRHLKHETRNTIRR